MNCWIFLRLTPNSLLNPFLRVFLLSPYLDFSETEAKRDDRPTFNDMQYAGTKFVSITGNKPRSLHETKAFSERLQVWQASSSSEMVTGEQNEYCEYSGCRDVFSCFASVTTLIFWKSCFTSLNLLVTSLNSLYLAYPMSCMDADRFIVKFSLPIKETLVQAATMQDLLSKPWSDTDCVVQTQSLISGLFINFLAHVPQVKRKHTLIFGTVCLSQYNLRIHRSRQTTFINAGYHGSPWAKRCWNWEIGGVYRNSMDLLLESW